jgi:predicted phage terminase large subunit-like protein
MVGSEPDLNGLQLYAQAARLHAKQRGFYGFVQAFWRETGEADAFIGNWHLQIICFVLELLAAFELGNTVINVPPATGKTLITTILWPAWVWATQDAGRRFIFTSYDHDLVHRTARKFLRLVISPAYRAAYPNVRLAATRPAEAEIENTSGGCRLAYQLGGGVTGKHAHHVVCDDPIKPSDAASLTSKQLTDCVDIWTGTFVTRRADPKRFNCAIIMQRLNHDDLAGVLLREHGYEHVCLPMRFVPDCSWDHGCSLGRLDIRTEPGELLWPDRYDEDAVRSVERALGSAQNAEAQLQQNPVPATGSFFETAWFRYWDVLPLVREMRIVQSWDLGFKGRKGNASADSFVSGLLMAVHGNRFLVLDEVHGRWNYPETKRQFAAAQQRELWRNPEAILVEDKANGTALISELEAAGKLTTPIRAVEPSGSKEDRARRHSAKVEAGRVWLPPVSQMPTVAEWLAEIVRFPHQKANDRVDTFTQALDYLGDDVAHWAEVWSRIWQNA